MNTESTDVAQDESATAEKPKLNLDVAVKETSACERHVTVTIPRDDIERYFQDQFDELIPKAEVPGFRTGRAPRSLVESKFRHQVSDQVKGSLLMDSLSQISDEQEFSAISEPNLDFELVSIPDEGDLTYEFDIEVRPEFDMPEWKGMELERPEHEFTDEEVDQHIQRLSMQFSDLVPVEEKVQADDYIVCDIVSRHDGKVITQASEKTIQVRPTLSLSDCTVEGFDKLMIGAAADEAKTANVTISEYSDNEELQGQEIEIEFTVLDVKRVELKTPEEVAEQVGMESVEAMREIIRKSLEDRLQYAQREQIRGQISSMLTESANWELPPELLRRQSRRELDRAVIEMRSSGFSESEIIARENSLRKNILEKTAVLLKEHFILERIAEEQEIEDSPADYELEIARIAIQRNDSPRRVRARLERTGQMDSMRNMIIERKVIDLIKDHATIKATDYDTGEETDTSAIDFFAAGGNTGEEIPEAKYDDAGDSQPLSGVVKETD